MLRCQLAGWGLAAIFPPPRAWPHPLGSAAGAAGKVKPWLPRSQKHCFSKSFGGKNLKRVGVILQRGILILLLCCFPCWAIFLNTERLLLFLRQDPEVAR